MNGFLGRQVLASFGLAAGFALVFGTFLFEAEGPVARFFASVFGVLSLACVALGFYYVNNDRVFSRPLRQNARRLASGWAGFYILVEGVTAATPLTDPGGWHWLCGALCIAATSFLRSFHPAYEDLVDVPDGVRRRIPELGAAAGVYVTGVALVEGWFRLETGAVPGVTPADLGVALWLSGLSVAVVAVSLRHRELTAAAAEPDEREPSPTDSETSPSLKY